MASTQRRCFLRVAASSNHHVDRIGTTPRLRQAREGLATSPDSPVERQPIRFNSSLCCRGTRAPSRRITRCPRLKPRIADGHFRRKNGLQCANDSDLLQAAGKSMQRQRMAAHRVFSPLGVRRERRESLALAIRPRQEKSAAAGAAVSFRRRRGSGATADRRSPVHDDAAQRFIMRDPWTPRQTT